MRSSVSDITEQTSKTQGFGELSFFFNTGIPGTTLGSILTWTCLVIMGTLFLKTGREQLMVGRLFGNNSLQSL